MYVNKFLVTYFLFFKVLLIYFGKLSFLFLKKKRCFNISFLCQFDKLLLLLLLLFKVFIFFIFLVF